MMQGLQINGGIAMDDRHEGEIQKLSQEEMKKILKETRGKLATQQQIIKEKKLPVLVLVEGWGAAGKGTLISYLIRDLDPRFFQVIPTKPPTKEEKRKPFLCRHMQNIPEAGQFVFLDAGWMEETVCDVIDGKCKGKELKKRLEDINIFERQLVDNGYLVLKIFVDVPKDIQKERIQRLLADEDTKWRVGKRDLEQVEERKKYEKAYGHFIAETNTPKAPWHVIDSGEKGLVELQVCHLLVESIDKAIKAKEVPVEIPENRFSIIPMPKLSHVSLDGTITQEEYEIQLKAAQKKLKKLHNKIYNKGIPVIIAYEGWDAAGKGGNIKRLTSALDARGFQVHPIASPDVHEKNRHFLWRFWTRLPKTGHVAIFDRTWYGRVMVERLEGFCSENDWQRAYNEINEFEKNLTDWGAVVVKFWIHIDKETQLKRFHEREATPEKRWKITEEDWRNREKWDDYEMAVDEILEKTSTEFAPWHVIQSNDKYFARIQAINIVIEAIESKLETLK
ncbi:MAG: polyphosphate:AMP phosphotransferase [Lachnospiraceae bacterium]|nr:polyphosphate:AMP phosphotransferase [Lachnospiraceae bacterium]